MGDVEARGGKMVLLVMEEDVVAVAETITRVAQVVPPVMAPVPVMVGIKVQMCLRMVSSAQGKVDSTRVEGGIIRDTITMATVAATSDTMVIMFAVLLR
jgi:hypothetical protein